MTTEFGGIQRKIMLLKYTMHMQHQSNFLFLFVPVAVTTRKRLITQSMKNLIHKIIHKNHHRDFDYSSLHHQTLIKTGKFLPGRYSKYLSLGKLFKNNTLHVFYLNPRIFISVIVEIRLRSKILVMCPNNRITILRQARHLILRQCLDNPMGYGKPQIKQL